ncbi:alpha-N-arabinofuranosidase [Jiangella asiatica]|uniref:non-reducing end alpha-L-arabinofuranosidase n=1 Tax=Jiangella asiatica TaxID=2530372 RepID=A0A4R5DIS0_9ACTN|nr:alpha-N-arabinofuranosidase [Jiangella asiatica]TDE10675.1 alpha-N-arabinofuranosidase [Jiangella asiatica]
MPRPDPPLIRHTPTRWAQRAGTVVDTGAGSLRAQAPTGQRGVGVNPVRLVLHSLFQTAALDRRLFGSFVEHMGRAVYTGIYEPGHPAADRSGFRADVLELVRELGPTVVRYPGGNFVSAYDWEDGVGPASERPVRLDLAWRARETNQVGLNEFAQWCRQAGTTMMLAVNLGTRGVDAARNLVEYCNHPSGTYWSDQRRAHGVASPHAITMWCLGNEMDAPWQIGHKTAWEYGRVAVEAAKAMRRVDPGIELVLCGSSNNRMPSFGAWEATALEEAYDQVDYISLHDYYEGDDDQVSFLASSDAMESFIGAVTATCDHIKEKLRSTKTMGLSFDEWNVWRQTEFHSHDSTREAWRHAPSLAEESYSVTDAVVVGSLLICLLNHADRVRIGCLAQLVNVIAPIMTEPGGPGWRQTTFYPFAHVARFARGKVLRAAEAMSAEHETEKYGRVASIVSAAVWNADDDELVVFVVNRSPWTAHPMEVTLGGELADYRLVEHLVLSHPDSSATNVAGAPATVVPVSRPVPDGNLVLEPVSWNVLRMRPIVGKDR